MKSEKFSKPYLPDNKTTAHPKRKSAGIYFIRVNKKLRYIGFSASDVYKAMYRHFQSWSDWRQQRFTYNRKNADVRIIYAPSFRASRMEKIFIRYYKPTDALNKYPAEVFDSLTDKYIIANFNIEENENIPF